MAEALTTQLEAVNSMLGAISEAPVNSITVGLIPSDVQIAVNLLNETSRDVQLTGYPWNSERDVQVSLALDGTVSLAGNTLDAKQTPGTHFNDQVEVVLRGIRLYDKRNHTYVFTAAPYCDIITYLSWDELPEILRTYIKVKAARVYQDRMVASDTIHAFTAADELVAYTKLQEKVAEQEQATIFDNWSIGSIWQSRRRPMGS